MEDGFWLRERFVDGFAKIGSKLYKQYGRAKSNAERLLINELVKSVDIMKISEDGRATTISTILRGRK